MWKGLKKALGHRANKAQKTGPGADVSVRSTSSAGQSSHGAGLFALDMADVDAALSEQQQKKQQQQQQPCHNQNNQQLPAPAAALTWAQLQQQLQQQHAVQQLMQQADDSTSKRRAAALQKRVNNSMLDPSTCLYQIKALLSLSTLFEHKLQRDTTQALQQQPSNLVSSLQALAQWQQAQAQAPPPPSPSKQQQLYSAGRYEQQQQQSAECAAGTPLCACCQGLAADGSQDSFCSCAGGGPACLRAPSATAASTAHVALQLAAWGYRVIVRKVVHSKAYWTKSMDNTFIVALDSSSGNHVEYIVDPHFQEAFNVGVMSDNYRAVWQSLPRVFVGMPCQLQSAVQLLCEEMELSFLEAGRPCPPWRGWAATINRWMSDQFVDILVPEPGAGSEEVAEYMARCTQLAAGGCGPGSSASSSSTATRGSSNALSTCSPPGGTVSQQRLGDKVHVSSVLSSVSAGGQRRVPEPLQKQLGFVAEAEAQQQQLHADGADERPERRVSISSSSGSSECGAPVAQQLAVQHGLCQEQEQQQQEQQAFDLADTVLGRRSSSSSSSCSSSGSSSSGGGASRSGSSSSKGKSLLTAQMQFRQQLQQRQQQQQLLQFAQGTTPAAAALQQGWLHHQQQQQQHHQQQQEQLLLMLQQQQQQQQQQLLLQQLQQGQAALAVQQPHAQGMQLLQLQQQQQPGLAGCAALLPVVHTVRLCGAAVPAAAAAPAAVVPASAAAMHTAAMQQLLPVQQRLQLQQQQQLMPGVQAVPQALHLVRPVQPQQQQGPQPPQQQLAQPQHLQLQASMHSSPEEQPKLLRLIPRSKAT